MSLLRLLVLLAGKVPLGGSTTWNPSDKGASVTLSNGNRTMSKAAAGQQAVRGTTSHAATGQYYSEFFCTSSGNCIVGQAGSLASLSNPIGFDVDGLGYRADGAVRYNNGTIATYAAYATGDVISMAHDFAAGKLWFAKNGIWQDGSPITGSGGLDIINTIFLAASAASGDAVTLNCGQDAFVFDPPPDYAPWG